MEVGRREMYSSACFKIARICFEMRNNNLKAVPKLSLILVFMGVTNETVAQGIRYAVVYRAQMHAATRYVELSLYVENYEHKGT